MAVFGFVQGPLKFLAIPQRRASQRVPLCASRSAAQPALPNQDPSSLQNHLLTLLRALREELPSLFGPNAYGPDLELYSPDVRFTDPLNNFTGARRYAANIEFLRSSFVFRDSRFFLHDAWIPDEPSANIVRTRWTLDMIANLPWKPRIAFTGTSDYVLDPKSGKVVEHIDRWDSLSSNENLFPSLSAVRDLLSQCWPQKVAPDPEDKPPFELLRRGKEYSIRRYPSRSEALANQHSVMFESLGSSSNRNPKDNRQTTHGLSANIIDVRKRDMVTPILCCFHRENQRLESSAKSDETRNTQEDLLVATMRLPTTPRLGHDIARARNILVRALKRDASATLRNADHSGTWVVCYPASSCGPGYEEFWVDVQSVRIRTP